jgi:4-aminobutyrate--pyruvate transaminase
VLRKHDILLVADEAHLRLRRTGQMFGSDAFGLSPDIMTMAEALSASSCRSGRRCSDKRIYEGTLTPRAASRGVRPRATPMRGTRVSSATVAIETLEIFEARTSSGACSA